MDSPFKHQFEAGLKNIDAYKKKKACISVQLQLPAGSEIGNNSQLVMTSYYNVLFSLGPKLKTKQGLSKLNTLDRSLILRL